LSIYSCIQPLNSRKMKAKRITLFIIAILFFQLSCNKDSNEPVNGDNEVDVNAKALYDLYTISQGTFNKFLENAPLANGDPPCFIDTDKGLGHRSERCDKCLHSG